MKTTTTGQLDLLKPDKTGLGPFELLCRSLDVKRVSNWPDDFGLALRKWAEKAIKRQVVTLSLFSGAGGLDIGFHDAGFNVRTMVEIDQRFVKTLQANTGGDKFFGKVEICAQDIALYRPTDKTRVDFIIGGPPCQTFSAAGRRAAGVRGTEDERGKLFEHYVRLLRHFKPTGFLFENVYGIIGAEQGKAWKEISESFKQSGYDICFRILDSADYGVPQHRERMFIVGLRSGDYRYPAPTHGPDSPDKRAFVSASEAISGSSFSQSEEKEGIGGRFGHLLAQIPPGLNYSFFTEKMGHPNPIFAWRSKFSDFLYKADPETPVRTLKAQGGQYTGPFHWENRPFSVSELKRLQTIPDRYVIVGGRALAMHQIGNSVPPQLSRVLALSILNQIFGIDLPSALPTLRPGQVLGFRKRKRALTSVYQAKAREALKKLTGMHNAGSEVSARTYTAELTQQFGWMASETGSIKISFHSYEEEWSFNLSNDGKNRKEAVRIVLSPVKRAEWALGVPQVVITITALSASLFTAAWKAFEAEVARFNLKADLVQLCGYYQYRPSFSGKMSVSQKTRVPERWRVVQAVVQGHGVRKIMAYHEIASSWSVQTSAVFRHALFLRTLGYEVRNHKTNPQIPRDHLLIPYAFPTLTPMSVQLRKSLEG